MPRFPILTQKKRGPTAKINTRMAPGLVFDFKFHHPVYHFGHAVDTFFREIHTEKALEAWGYPCILTSSAGFGRPNPALLVTKTLGVHRVQPIASEMTWMDDWYLHLDGAVFLLPRNLFQGFQENIGKMSHVSSQNAPNP